MNTDNVEPQTDAPTASRSDWLFTRLPPWIVDTLTNEQKEAIHNAATDPSWSNPPINIRMSIPFFGHRYFLTIVGGEGKRNFERRRREKHKYPLRTAANIFFILGIGGLFYIAALIAMALQGAIIKL